MDFVYGSLGGGKGRREIGVALYEVYVVHLWCIVHMYV